MDSIDKAKIEDLLTLEYFGPPTKMGRMDSYAVASYIMAFSDFLGMISRQVYGEKIEIKTEIQGFKGNTFDINFFWQVAFITANLFITTPLSPKEFISLIQDSIKLWIQLKGSSPKQISPVPTVQNTLNIENINGDFFYATRDVLNLVADPKAGKAVEGFIKSPLESGLDHLRINSKTYDEIAKIEKKDSVSFVPINIEKSLLETEMTMHLLIESPTFREGNKWRFWDGQNSFLADLLDEDFLKKVDSGKERFGKGDALKAIVRFSQSGSKRSLKMDRSIIKVLEHEIAIEPDKLL